MPLGRGVYYRIKTFPSGKRVRLAFKNGRVIETKAIVSKPTKSGKRLARARRRIGLR
jgi:hypothetical protein